MKWRAWLYQRHSANPAILFFWYSTLLGPSTLTHFAAWWLVRCCCASKDQGILIWGNKKVTIIPMETAGVGYSTAVMVLDTTSTPLAGHLRPMIVGTSSGDNTDFPFFEWLIWRLGPFPTLNWAHHRVGPPYDFILRDAARRVLQHVSPV